MIAKESYTFQRNRKKNRLQSSQEMVNAADKVSVSVRRAFNVNRCQQDNLDNKVWTLERECRKSLGLLSLEQRKFIRSLKPPATTLKIDTGQFTKRSSLKPSMHLPALVNGRKFQSNDCAVKWHPGFSYQDRGYKGSRDNQTLTDDKLAGKVYLPSITATKPNKSRRHECKKTRERKNVDLETSESEEKLGEWREKDEDNSSWKVDKENFDKLADCRIKVKNLKKLPSLSGCDEVTKDSLVCDDGTNKLPKHTNSISKLNHLNPSSLHNMADKRSECTLPLRKFGLMCKTHPSIHNYIDKNTEIRVQKFLKLPSIGGIRDSPAEVPNESGQNVNQFQEEWRRKTGRVVNPQQTTVEIKNKVSWKNLVHCRYLRLGDQCEKVLPIETCQCNWCTMMKKLKV